MIHQNYHLHTYRKHSHLKQSDIAFILDLSDYSNIGRWEKGSRKPTIDALLVYHLLFDMPIESLFDLQKRELLDVVTKRIALRRDELKARQTVWKTDKRVSFLDSAHTRLTAPFKTI